MKKEKREESFIKKPFYKGGGVALNDLIYKNLKYPKEALESKVEGTVFCKYDIDYKGEVVDVKVMKGIGHGCDEEAVRLVKLLKFEVPKNPRGLKVLFHKDIHIQFKFTEVKENIQIDPLPANQSTFAITYTETTPKASPAKDQAAPYSYTYTIKL